MSLQSRILSTGITVYAGVPINRRRLFRDRILVALGLEPDSPADKRMFDEFADITAFTDHVDGDAGFTLLAEHAKPEEILANYAVYVDNVNGVQSEEWLTFIRRVLSPSNQNRATQPPPLTEQEKAADPN